MIESIISWILLFGLGLKTPHAFPAVLGDQDVVIQSESNRKEQNESLLIVNTQLQEKDTETNRVKKQEEKNQKPQKPMPAIIREDQKSRVDEFKAEIRVKREQAKQEAEARRESFKKRLESMKDERKKNVVVRIDQQLSDINTKRTQQMSERIARMENMVAILIEKANRLESEGNDVSSARSAIAFAQTSLSVAKTAVEQQAKKEYIIGITMESKAREDIKRTLDQMRKDMKQTHEKIEQARMSVVSAVKAVAMSQ